jgi:hypothetical protein
MIDRLRRLLIKKGRMRPYLVVIQGGLGTESDPRRYGWNRDWTPGQHGGGSFTTDSAHVDVVNPQARQGAKIFVGGSRTFSDRAAIADKISQLPRNVVVLTSPTHGASAAVRDAVQDQRLQMQVWTARLEKFRTKDDAYFARDEEMIRSAERVIEFWDGRSAGTSHELEYARKIGKPVELVRPSLKDVPKHGRQVRRPRPPGWRGPDPDGGRAA